MPLNLDAGLHAPENVSQFKDPKKLQTLCRELLDEDAATLKRLVQKTTRDVCVRVDQGYLSALIRDHTTGPAEGEQRLERSIWVNWRHHVKAKPEEFLPGIPFLIGYQVPLYNRRNKDSWGAVDLMGVSSTLLPVVIELKRADNTESPLRMLLEAVAYSISIRRAWQSRFRQDWQDALERIGITVAVLPDSFTRSQAVCLAPNAYWQPWTEKKAVNGWCEFRQLVQVLQDSFEITTQFAVLRFDVANLAI